MAEGDVFFWNDGASFIIFEHNFASVAKMYKTVLCFEMSSSLFSRLYGNTQFLVKTLRELHRSKLQTIKTFLFVQLYTPKRLWFWLLKSQVKKNIAVSTSAQNAPHVHSVSRLLAHWACNIRFASRPRLESRQRPASGWILFSNQTARSRFEARFVFWSGALGRCRRYSAMFCCLLPSARWSKKVKNKPSL